MPKADELVFLQDAWNDLPEGIAPRIQKRYANPIIKEWKKAQKQPELRDLFNDQAAVTRLMAKIRGSTFLRNWAGFTFTWLFKSKQGEWNALKIAEGNYDDDKPGNQQRDPSRITGRPESLKYFDGQY